MKKLSIFAATVLTAFMLSGCGAGTGSSIASGTSTTSTTNTSAAGGLAAVGSSLLSGSTGSLLGGSTGSSLLGTLMSSLLGNTTTQNSIIGTWVYSKPKIAFESESILAQLGSTIASNKLESSLDTQFKKLGFTAGKTAFTFQQDGSCTMTLGSRSIPGTYTYNSKTGQMTIKGTLGLTNITAYVSVMGSEMYILFDADKLLNVMSAVSSVTKVSTLSSLISNYNGIKIGWTLTKK